LKRRTVANAPRCASHSRCIRVTLSRISSLRALSQQVDSGHKLTDRKQRRANIRAAARKMFDLPVYRDLAVDRNDLLKGLHFAFTMYASVRVFAHVHDGSVPNQSSRISGQGAL